MTVFAAVVLLGGVSLPGQATASPLVAEWSFEEGPADAPATGPIVDFNGLDQHVFIPDDPAFAFTGESRSWFH